MLSWGDHCWTSEGLGTGGDGCFNESCSVSRGRLSVTLMRCSADNRTAGYLSVSSSPVSLASASFIEGSTICVLQRCIIKTFESTDCSTHFGERYFQKKH